MVQGLPPRASRISSISRTPASDWWDAQPDHAFAHRFTRYLREVALVERPERLVLFVDEIDTTLRLDFTDDFFAAIRFLYQNRAADPELQRLSFVLIGVATPRRSDQGRRADAVQHRPPHRADRLHVRRSLRAGDASPVPAPVGRDLIALDSPLDRRHPYLTLRAVRSLAESPPPEWTADAVDERVRDLFLRAGARATATCSSSATC